MSRVFVFGSNLAGRHGKGAALTAKRKHRAKQGVGVGVTGDSYAIPTKGWKLEILPLATVAEYVASFLRYAKGRPGIDFDVTAIGCGLAGYTPEKIAPMFEPARDMPNVYLPAEFCRVLGTSRVSFPDTIAKEKTRA